MNSLLKCFIGGWLIGVGAEMLYGEMKDAFQERKATAVLVRKTSKDSQEVGERDEAEEVTL